MQAFMPLQVDALWQPDLHLLPGNVCNAIQGLEGISSERVGVKCSICERSDGAVIRCAQGHCSVPFHPLCARNAGHYLSVHPTSSKTVYRAFCATHSQQARNKDQEMGISIEVLLVDLQCSNRKCCGQCLNGAVHLFCLLHNGVWTMQY